MYERKFKKFILKYKFIDYQFFAITFSLNFKLQINNDEVLLRQCLLMINMKRNVNEVCGEYVIKRNYIDFFIP